MIDLFNWQQMARCYLDFPFEDQPKWRDHKQPTTNEMVKDIVEFRKKYEQLPEHAKQFCTGDFSSIMAVEFICHLDVGRAVGSQTKRGTKDVMKLIYDNASKKPDRDDKEGLGTFNAWDAMNNLTTLNGGFLTVENILMVHKILMEGLVEKLEENGKLRETCTYVNWEGSLYIYPRHQDVEDKLHAVVDRHSVYIEQMSKIENHSKEKVEHVFKCAARLLFDFVDTHPFGDGNGRMCRLLANFVVNLITPFPVALYQPSTDNSGYTNYVNAIVQCRDNREEGPRELAAMLVEGAWNGWKIFFRTLESYEHSFNTLGFFVIKASDAGNIAKNVRRILKSRKSELDNSSNWKYSCKYEYCPVVLVCTSLFFVFINNDHFHVAVCICLECK